MKQFAKGMRVKTWFADDGVGGGYIVGEVVSAGPRAAIVRWESGIQNRVPQPIGSRDVHEYNGEFDE